MSSEARRVLPVLLLCACASSRPATLGDSGPGDQAGSRLAARRARELVTEAQESLRRGDLDGMHALLDGDLLAIGPREALGSRSDALVALAAGFGGGQKHRVAASALEVAGSPGGRAAVVAADLSVDGQPYQLAAVVAENDGIWSASVLHLARPPAQRPAEPAALPPLPDGPPSPPAREAIALVAEGLANPERFLAQLAAGRDVYALGSARAMARGPLAVRRAWDTKQRMRPLGKPRAGTTSDGTLAWVATNVEVTPVGRPAAARRYLFIYARARPADPWRLVALHGSAPAP